jgi:hypothetical protein
MLLRIRKTAAWSTVHPRLIARIVAGLLAYRAPELLHVRHHLAVALLGLLVVVAEVVRLRLLQALVHRLREEVHASLHELREAVRSHLALLPTRVHLLVVGGLAVAGVQTGVDLVVEQPVLRSDEPLEPLPLLLVLPDDGLLLVVVGDVLLWRGVRLYALDGLWSSGGSWLAAQPEFREDVHLLRYCLITIGASYTRRSHALVLSQSQRPKLLVYDYWVKEMQHICLACAHN